MPKKTKKQKILADLRRKTANKKQVLKSSKFDSKKESKSNAETPNSYHYSLSKQPKTQIAKNVGVTNYSLVINDLVRFLAFTFLALGSQIVLYFLLQG